MAKKKKKSEASVVDSGGAVVVDLENPIEFAGKTIDQLTIRPLKAKWMRGLRMTEERSMDVILTLAGRMSGKADAVINELTGDDLRGVIDAVVGFMETSLPSGEIPSLP